MDQLLNPGKVMNWMDGGASLALGVVGVVHGKKPRPINKPWPKMCNRKRKTGTHNADFIIARRMSYNLEYWVVSSRSYSF